MHTTPSSLLALWSIISPDLTIAMAFASHPTIARQEGTNGRVRPHPTIGTGLASNGRARSKAYSNGQVRTPKMSSFWLPFRRGVLDHSEKLSYKVLHNSLLVATFSNRLVAAHASTTHMRAERLLSGDFSSSVTGTKVIVQEVCKASEDQEHKRITHGMSPTVEDELISARPQGGEGAGAEQSGLMCPKNYHGRTRAMGQIPRTNIYALSRSPCQYYLLCSHVAPYHPGSQSPTIFIVLSSLRFPRFPITASICATKEIGSQGNGWAIRLKRACLVWLFTSYPSCCFVCGTLHLPSNKCFSPSLIKAGESPCPFHNNQYLDTSRRGMMFRCCPKSNFLVIQRGSFERSNAEDSTETHCTNQSQGIVSSTPGAIHLFHARP
ncbi:hypothetical protein SODALDRAFT_378283 [Sodiomyces alkalinus F11]|uniref:Secreted protein n=1 Tax=Sodiomyces alkalinus (strain CBS 110278 / VKM F-3762 / F11) TaxID=1314773 RepID=A0A3N2PXB5_SODAK|nr:hypothetical protein SODALDRAFT_378283 [Sodiomyces alkalinus F11]ROT39173.1 hypothetical protein SODALDRAFT_378283 [Sodiomyces alkalinus F11]